jgi:uncharacterized membrane protein YedE/YeeE
MVVALVAFICGLIFGLGLIVSGMASPLKVLNFLDVAGTWDPSLLVVMVAALAVSAAGYAVARRRGALLVDQCQWPNTRGIDAPLVVGALMFGTGWGLVGLCPGPAIVNLATLSPQVIVFVLAMSAGMWLHDGWRRLVMHRPRAAATADG